MDEKRIAIAVEKVVRLLRENPEWTHKQAIDKAKEVLSYESIEMARGKVEHSG